MWTLVDTDNTPTDAGQTNSSDSPAMAPASLASRLPDPAEYAIAAAATAVPARRPSRWRALGYLALSLVLATGLLAQIGYRHLERISQHETIRPWLLTVCELAGCVLPTRQDSSLIISNQLSITPHPDYQAISRMTLRFSNAADFAQPLPIIELIYTDIRSQTVAGRRFYPRHYLDESQAAATSFTLSAQETLVAQLEFATPAADAANYQVRFSYE